MLRNDEYVITPAQVKMLDEAYFLAHGFNDVIRFYYGFYEKSVGFYALIDNPITGKNYEIEITRIKKVFANSFVWHKMIDAFQKYITLSASPANSEFIKLCERVQNEYN